MTPFIDHYDHATIHQAELRHQRQAIRDAKRARHGAGEHRMAETVGTWPAAFRKQLLGLAVILRRTAAGTKARAVHLGIASGILLPPMAPQASVRFGADRRSAAPTSDGERLTARARRAA